jgi:dTMP kinase
MGSQIIAIEGLDGSGKSTQIGLLRDHLKGKGVETKFVHFPRVNEGVYGDLIAKFLRGEYGSAVHPQFVSLLFAGDRMDFAPTLRQWLDEGYFILMDRYVLSNIAFQCAKVQDLKARGALRDWINMFEYEYNRIPKPDLSFYLDVPFSFVQRTLQERRTGASRDYLNGKDDIHEKDTALQLAVMGEYQRLIDMDKTITRIVCCEGDANMRPAAEIHADIVARLSA